MAIIQSQLEVLKSRSLPNGGFSNFVNGEFRPDATAWAILAFEKYGYKPGLIEAARDRLASSQKADGRVCLYSEMPEIDWPTPLAALAWQGAEQYRTNQDKAIAFLLSTSGTHWENSNREVIGHDTSLKGWGWLDSSHSFIQPTALALMALQVCGKDDSGRFREGIDVIMDRQLPHGGWNYGNTTVYGRELRPMPETTGLALSAIAEYVPKDKVSRSLAYLKSVMEQAESPVSLAWGVSGLGAWDSGLPNAESLFDRIVANQSMFGPYGTDSLGLLLFSIAAPHGLARAFEG